MVMSKDSLLERVADEWLRQYSQFRRVDGELTNDLQQRPDEFELVPVPRKLLQFLAAPEAAMTETFEDELRELFGRADPPPVEVSALGQLLSARAPVTRKRPEWLWQMVRELAAALERGDASECARLLAADFRGPAGQNREEIMLRLEQLIKATELRRVIPLDLDVVMLGEDLLEAELRLVWEANRARPQSDPTCAAGPELEDDDRMAAAASSNAETLTCTLQMIRDAAEGAWKIRHLVVA